jgi:hypothetical protein
MLRWLVLVGLVFGLGSGLRHGWIEVRWDRLLHDLGLPVGLNPAASAAGAAATECPPAQAAASSSSSEARNPSR